MTNFRQFKADLRSAADKLRAYLKRGAVVSPLLEPSAKLASSKRFRRLLTP